jgi:hypothetical protein
MKRLNTKKKWITMTVAMAGLVGTGYELQATPIAGSISFDGGAVLLNNTLPNATAIDSFGGTTVVSGGANVPTGSYAGLAGTAVTMTSEGFIFSPGLSPSPINDLWSFTVAGITYDFNLLSATGVYDNGSLDLSGTGTLQITGDTDTAGTWTMDINGGGDGDNFNFDANNEVGGGGGNGGSSVPDGGSTAMMLGAGLSGVALLGRKKA